ncbi:Uncharacterised protein [Mycobacterium tuberculosis]|uniref:Uncharacterized protein n=1 Tax=Mycobacterium tuberculosis TaxID=1773 RepID=A0A916LBQ2_MYCTX|nr:Uncharacterised protein [Mycobacterium tuberculosis]
MGALRPGGEHGLQLRGICGQFVNSGLDRVDEFDDGLGGVFLQIAVAVSGIAVDENVDVGPGDRRLDVQQVRHPWLDVRVIADVTFAVGHGGANLLGGQCRIVEQVDQTGIGARRFAHL